MSKSSSMIATTRVEVLSDSDDEGDITVLDIKKLVEEEERKEALCVVDLTDYNICHDSDNSGLDDIIDITDEVRASKAKERSNDVATSRKAVLKDFSRPGSPGQAVIVVDTNMFVHALNYLKWIRTGRSQVFTSVQLLVPWTVIRELDSLKMQRGCWDVCKRSRKAIRYLNQCLVNKDLFLVVQTPHEEAESCKLMTVCCNDDKILCCCLLWQLKLSQLGCRENVFLLSDDVNLRNKALVMNVVSFDCERVHTKLRLISVQSRPIVKPQKMLIKRRRHAKTPVKQVAAQATVMPMSKSQVTVASMSQSQVSVETACQSPPAKRVCTECAPSTLNSVSPSKKKWKNSHSATVTAVADAPVTTVIVVEDSPPPTAVVNHLNPAHREAFEELSRILVPFLENLFLDQLKKCNSSWEAAKLCKQQPCTLALVNILKCYDHRWDVVLQMPLKKSNRKFLKRMIALFCKEEVLSSEFAVSSSEMSCAVTGFISISDRLRMCETNGKATDKLLKTYNDLIELRKRFKWRTTSTSENACRITCKHTLLAADKSGQLVTGEKIRKTFSNGVKLANFASSDGHAVAAASERRPSLRLASPSDRLTGLMQQTENDLQQTTVICLNDSDDDVMIDSNTGSELRPTNTATADVAAINAQDSVGVTFSLAWQAIKNWRLRKDEPIFGAFRETVLKLGCCYKRVLKQRAVGEQAKLACLDLCAGFRQLSILLGQTWPQLVPETLLTLATSSANRDLLQAGYQQLKELTQGLS